MKIHLYEYVRTDSVENMGVSQIRDLKLAQQATCLNTAIAVVPETRYPNR